MNDRPYYPWKEGDRLYASELNAAIANASAMPPVLSGGATNALWYGADPTGMTDSSVAINEALAARHNGRPLDVFLPAGTYLLCCPLMLGDAVHAQRLFGAGWSTVLAVNPGFQASADGVILIEPSPYNDFFAQASVCDLRIHFQQPPDFSARVTGSGTPVGGFDVLVDDVSGIHIGYYCFNQTNSDSLPWQSIAPKVTDVRGTLVTLDRPALQTIDPGDVLLFAANRSQAVALSSAANLNPGSPAIKYPWAIYNVSQSFFMDHVLVSGAWNGVYIRGQTFVIGQYFEGCLNVGLDIDQCHNFPKIDHFMHWGWGIPQAMQGIYYDGQTVAANLGACDDFTCDVLQTWCAIVNITPAWTWGQINQLKLDGDNANLNAALSPGSWVQIGKCYKSGGQHNIGLPIAITGGGAVFIGNFHIITAQNNPTITLAGGALTISGGYMWNGQVGNPPMINVTGGDLSIEQMQFDSSEVRGAPYLIQTGGSVRVSNSAFVRPPAPGVPAFLLTDTARNSINDVDLNGWSFPIPGPLGRYEVTSTEGVSYSNGTSNFVDPDTPTTAQVTIRPKENGPPGQEGKLRLYGVFPTGTDLVPRLSASIRAGFGSAFWLAPRLDFWIANGQNDVHSDANMTLAARFQLNVIVLPPLAASPSHADDATAALGGVPVGGLYRNGSQVMVRVT